MIDILLLILGLYLAVGLLFGALFIILGAARIDSVAAQASLRVRLIFLPGAVALWPLLLIGMNRSMTHTATEASPLSRALRRRHLIFWFLIGPIVLGTVVLAVVHAPESIEPSVRAIGGSP